MGILAAARCARCPRAFATWRGLGRLGKHARLRVRRGKTKPGWAVSDTDSFIDEVTEEVRRDKLFAMFRKYGWIGIVAVVAIVGGTAFNEWKKAQVQAASQAFGDAVVAAMADNDAKARVAALRAIATDAGTGRAAVLGFLVAAEADAAGDKDAAVAALKAVAADAALPDLYRQMAQLKMVTTAGAKMDPAERDSILQALATPGAPFRALAIEQHALVLLENGKTDEAAAMLTALQQDADSTPALVSRVGQILTMMGRAAPDTAQPQGN